MFSHNFSCIYFTIKKVVIAENAASGLLKVYDQNLLMVRWFQAHNSYINIIKQSPFNGSYVATGSSDLSVKIWTVSDWSLFRTYKNHTAAVYCLAFLSVDTIASGEQSASGTIKIWSLSSGLTSKTINAGSFVYALQLLSNGYYLAVGLSNFNINIYNINMGSLVISLSGHTGSVVGLALINSNLLASTSNDYTVRIWDLTTNATKFVMTGHAVYGARFISSDNILATGSGDNTIKLWNVTSGSFIRTLSGHGSSIYWSVDVLNENNGDNQTLISGSYDQTIKTWNYKTGTVLSTFDVGMQISSLTVIKSSSKKRSTL